jgi:hypothetical protein
MLNVLALSKEQMLDFKWTHCPRGIPDGRGLVFAGGNTIGTALVVTPTGGTAGLKVFATLICENVPTFVQRNTNLAGVPLAANGDFKIDDMLSPPPLPRSSCATPVLLIRSTAGNLTWFAAGIQKFGGSPRQHL